MRMPSRVGSSTGGAVDALYASPLYTAVGAALSGTSRLRWGLRLAILSAGQDPRARFPWQRLTRVVFRQ